MNRRDFLKILAGGTVAAVVPSIVLAEPVKRGPTEEDIRRMAAELDKADVPQNDRVMWVSKEFYETYREEIAKQFRDKPVINGYVGTCMGMRVYRA